MLRKPFATEEIILDSNQEIKLLHESTKKFVNANLIELCKEISEFSRTGILGNGIVREVIAMNNYAGHSSMSLTTTMISQDAIYAISCGDMEFVNHG